MHKNSFRSLNCEHLLPLYFCWNQFLSAATAACDLSLYFHHEALIERGLKEKTEFLILEFPESAQRLQSWERKDYTAAGGEEALFVVRSQVRGKHEPFS